MFNVAASLLQAVGAALVAAEWSGDRLVSHGPAGVPLGTPCGGDQLAVWLTEAGPARQSYPEGTGRVSVQTADLTLRLTIACWPTQEVGAGQAVIYPSAAEQQQAAAWSYHWRCVAYDATKTWLADSTPGTSKFDQLGRVTQIDPGGGMAGWQWGCTAAVTPARVRPATEP